MFVTFAIKFSSFFFCTQADFTDMLDAAQNLVRMISNSLPANVRPVRQDNAGGAAVGQSVQSLMTTVRPQKGVQQRAQCNGHKPSSKQELARYETNYWS